MTLITCILVATLFTSPGIKAAREIGDWMKAKFPEEELENENK